MLDIHSIQVTPGAGTTLGVAGTVPAVNDLASIAYVPANVSVKNNILATMVMWGFTSIVADTIAAVQLQDQDQNDPVNAELVTPGTSSLINLFQKFSRIPYIAGPRYITAGTNTGVTAGLAHTLDYYNAGLAKDGKGMRFAPNQGVYTQTLNTDVANTWTTTPFVPAKQMPNGVYALLGAWLAKSTGGKALRFQHADFKQYLPGFLMTDSFASAILGFQEGMKDTLQVHQGYQFVHIAELTGLPCVPVFSVSQGGTGLNIQSLAPANTDTPVVSLNVAKISK